MPVKQVSRRRPDMNTPVGKTQSKTGTKGPKFSNFEEGNDMRSAKHIGRVKTPVKLLVGLAAGAMLVTATAFTYHELRQNEAASLPGGSQPTQALHSPVYPASQVDNTELWNNLMGITLTTEDFQAPVYLGPEVHEVDEMAMWQTLMGSPVRLLTAEEMKARIEIERLEDPDLDGMLFDMLMGPPAGSSPSGE
jgi:hypothetical protein